MGKRCGPWLLYFFGGEFEGDGVDAVALAGGGAGGVVEDVTEVGIAIGTGDFGTDHAVRCVAGERDRVACLGGVEGRPTATGIEFGVGFKEFPATGGAGVGSGVEVIIEFVVEGAFGPFFSEDAIGLR